jgi:hypothetical protein
LTIANWPDGFSCQATEEAKMPSRQCEQLVTICEGWIAAPGARPDMPLEELLATFEHRGGVDYIEADAGGSPALWAAPKGCGQAPLLLCSHGGGYVLRLEDARAPFIATTLLPGGQGWCHLAFHSGCAQALVRQ